MTTFSKAKAQLNHTVARWEANHKLINRRIAPAVGGALGIAALGFDLSQAKTPENKKKVLIRDGLILGGIVATSLLGLWTTVIGSKNGKFYGRGLSLEKIKKLVEKDHKTREGFKTYVGQAADWINKKLFREKGSAGGFHSHDGTFGRSAMERVQGLFRSSVHEHGTSGAIKMTLMAALPIYLGGMGFGTVADAINGEDWRTNWKLKFKEGTFQFLGNITMCTVGILLLSKLARASSNALWKNSKGLKERFIKGTKNKLDNLTKASTDYAQDKRLIPSGFSQVIEGAFVEGKKDTAKIGKQLKDKFRILYREEITDSSKYADKLNRLTQQWVKSATKDKTVNAEQLKKSIETHIQKNKLHKDVTQKQQKAVFDALSKSHDTPEDLIKSLKPKLQTIYRKDIEKASTVAAKHDKDIEKALETHKLDKNAVKAALWKPVAERMKADIEKFSADGKTLTAIAKNRLDSQADVIGVVLGFLTGVFGGAVVSNGVNQFLTKYAGFPEGHTVNGLFKGHHHGDKKAKETPAEGTKDDGWLAGKLGGPRGLHWFDWMLHADDIPAALYMAGVEIVESSIQVLYGISALVTGTAGTDYTGEGQKAEPYATFDTIQKPKEYDAFQLNRKPGFTSFTDRPQ